MQQGVASFIRMDLGATTNFRAIAAKVSMRAAGHFVCGGRVMKQHTASICFKSSGRAEQQDASDFVVLGRHVRQETIRWMVGISSRGPLVVVRYRTVIRTAKCSGSRL